MTPITAETTIRQIVVDLPASIRIFESFGIDYCCGGNRTLAQACADKKSDPRALLDSIRLLSSGTPSPTPIDAATMGLTDLARHIIVTHHDALRDAFPRMSEAFAKVVRAHGGTDPRLAKAQAIFEGLQEEMNSHMMKEEMVLFPLIAKLESATRLPQFHCGSVSNPIRAMESEHESAGDALAQISSLTDGHTVPANACPTYRRLMELLRWLENDLRRHVHLENNILFPRAIQTEERLAGAAHVALT